MTRPLLALMRLKPGCPSLDGLEKCFRRSFSLSSGLGVVRRLWTAEESHKLVELYQKGLSTTEISEQLGRNRTSVVNHRKVIMNGKSEISSRKQWTAEEDSILLAKRQAGCLFKDMVLPGRSPQACQQRCYIIRNLERFEGKHPAKKSGKPFTHAELQRIIDLYVIERKSPADIGEELGRSEHSIKKIWHKSCKRLVPQKVLQRMRPRNGWSSEDDDRLVTLYNKGMKVDELGLHFPEKSVNSAKYRAYILHHRLVGRRLLAPPDVMESLKRELEPYLDALPARGYLKRVQKRFPMCSAGAISETLSRMRRGKAFPVRLPFDEVEPVEAERGIASRSSRRAV
jgi:DNA-binding CsgD family transcriptional regulator